MSVQTAIATLVAGFVIGYLWQRARACSITGYRDFYMFRDTQLLKTVVGMFAGAFGGFLIFARFSNDLHEFPMLLATPTIDVPLMVVFAVVGGLGFGFFSVLAGGCPLKIHVNASQGTGSAIYYLMGFYTGLVYYQIVIIEFVTWLLQRGP